MVKGNLAFELKCHTGTLTPGDQSASSVFVLEESPYYLTCVKQFWHDNMLGWEKGAEESMWAQEEGCYKGWKAKLSMCLTNYALRHEGVWGSGCIDPHFLDLGTSWRWVVSFTPRPLYPRGKSPRYPLYRRFGGPQNRSGQHGEEEILTPTATRTPTLRSSSP
jgi:hypothetical protein